MSDWIRRMAEDEKRKLQDDARRQDFQLHRAKIIEVSGPAVWDRLRLKVQQDVDQYQQNFPGERAMAVRFDWTGETGLDAFRVTKKSHPAVTLDVTLELAAQSINVCYTSTAEFGAEEQCTTSKFRFEVDEKDRVYLSADGREVLSAGQVSERLLRPVLAA